MKSLRGLLNIIQNDIVDLVHNQAVHSQIVTALDLNRSIPFEQDEIYNDVFGRYPSEGIVKELCGTRIKIRATHQTGKNLSDIAGADLLYEIEGLKYIIVQYKKRESYTYNVDINQLKKLMTACPQTCSFKRHQHTDFIENRLHGMCGIYYKFISNNSENYLHACEVNKKLTGKQLKLDSGVKGLSKHTFEELFATCKIGAPLSMTEVISRQTKVLEQNDLVVRVEQANTFLR